LTVHQQRARTALQLRGVLCRSLGGLVQADVLDGDAPSIKTARTVLFCAVLWQHREQRVAAQMGPSV
jgi:hypothetical protein